MIEIGPDGRVLSVNGAKVKHGTHARYRKGCRCDECREANRKYHLKERWKRRCKIVLGEPVPHGLSGYINHGCRCDVCRAVKSVQNAERYA